MCELSHCPFCGETESVRMMTRKGKDGWRDRYFVRCEYDSGGCGAESGWYHTEEEAAYAWNHRSVPEYALNSMEGIFIRGMILPDSCGYCPLANDECFGSWKCRYSSKWGSDDSRSEDCPMLKLHLPLTRKEDI